jgi:hypothetical protein
LQKSSIGLAILWRIGVIAWTVVVASAPSVAAEDTVSNAARPVLSAKLKSKLVAFLVAKDLFVSGSNITTTDIKPPKPVSLRLCGIDLAW